MKETKSIGKLALVFLMLFAVSTTFAASASKEFAYGDGSQLLEKSSKPTIIPGKNPILIDMGVKEDIAATGASEGNCNGYMHVGTHENELVCDKWASKCNTTKPSKVEYTKPPTSLPMDYEWPIPSIVWEEETEPPIPSPFYIHIPCCNPNYCVQYEKECALGNDAACNKWLSNCSKPK